MNNHIEIKRIKVLQGANRWAYRPVLEILADIGKYEELPSNKIPGFTDRLVEAVPTLWEHRCSEGQPGGFLERLRHGTYMGHIIEHVILELQSLAGMNVSYGKTRSAGRRGQYYIVVAYKDATAGKMCADLAVSLVEHAAEGEPLPFDLDERISEIKKIAEDNMLGPSTQAIVNAARRRGIPWFRLDGEGGALVQLGHGRYAKRIQASETSLTSSVAVDIASNKELTKQLLSQVGIPVPEGRVVSNPDDAWEAAQALGAPVVVKPHDGNQGKAAVSVNLTGEEQVVKAFEMAQQISREVMVERYVSGSDYRLLVVDGKLIAAALRRPPQVVGDGLHTISELVRMVNGDPRRGSGHGAALTRIKMDGAAQLTLEKQGFTWESVLEPGQVALLRDNSNLSTGGTAIDVTDDVHPDNAEIAVLAARTVGLDVAGVDVVCRNISRPLADQDGAIVEVNAAPGLRMHIYPSEGKSRPVGDAIVNMLFPQNAQVRVPLIAVTGTNGKTTVTRMIAHIYSTMKRYVGMTSTDGVYFNGVRRVKADASGPRSAEAVLQHPLVEVAVLETARGGILRSGLAWDRSDVSAVLNIAGDHMGLDGIETLEDLARVKRVIVESVSDDGYAVLNADDDLVAEMAEYCPGRVIYFGMDCASPVISAHMADGGKAVYVEGGDIVLAEGSNETRLIKTADIPATYGGLIPFQVQNAMAAAASCWGAGVELQSIRLGLRTFQADDKNAPGRFNMFEVGRARVIYDYAHNPHALRAVQAAIEQIKPRRSIGVIASPGDRRDADTQELALVAAHTFDWVIVREDDDLRGRERGEVANLMASTIATACPSLPVCIIEDEMESVEQALEMARAGDLVVIFADHVDEVIEHVRRAGKVVATLEREAVWRPGETVLAEPKEIDQHDLIEAVAELTAQGVYTAKPATNLDGDGKSSKQDKGWGQAPKRGGRARKPDGMETVQLSGSPQDSAWLS